MICTRYTRHAPKKPRVPRYTRKTKRVPPVIVHEVVQRCWMSEQFEEFKKEGDFLFDYMIHNFETMIDGETRIKNFEMYNAVYGIDSEIEILSEKTDDIQRNLIPWIRKEYEAGRLFQPENWMPLRDPDLIVSMLYLGYRRMFVYEQHYFQLAVVSNCEILCPDCIFCKSGLNIIYFGLGYYGWKDETCKELLPDKIFAPCEEIPEWFWNKR